MSLLDVRDKTYLTPPVQVPLLAHKRHVRGEGRPSPSENSSESSRKSISSFIKVIQEVYVSIGPGDFSHFSESVGCVHVREEVERAVVEESGRSPYNYRRLRAEDPYLHPTGLLDYTDVLYD